jgi:NCS1 family nucleobase:cation symporter-1
MKDCSAMPRMNERMNSHLRATLLSNRVFSQYVQPFVIPIVFTLCSFVGIAVTSAGIQLYGKVLWDPLLLIDHWENRAAAFFASFVFALTTIGTNISANSLGAGNDMTVLCPKVNIHFIPEDDCSFGTVYQHQTRTNIVCDYWWLGIMSMGDSCQVSFSPPHEFAQPLSSDSAQGFLSFMDGYTIFLGPFAGIMVTDVGLTYRHAWSRLVLY